MNHFNHSSDILFHPSPAHPRIPVIILIQVADVYSLGGGSMQEFIFFEVNTYVADIGVGPGLTAGIKENQVTFF